MKKKLILTIKYGGLGDHLFYSHIPRIAKETGAYSHVYISNQSEFRDPEYRKLIWAYNPYFDGFVDEPGITVTTEKEKPGIIQDFIEKNRLGKGMDSIMLGLGLDDGKRNHEPELYYTPPLRNDLTSLSVYDPNSISGGFKFINQHDLKRTLKKEKIVIDCQLEKRGKENVWLDEIPKTLSSKTIWEFCSIIYSCKTLYCLATGTAHLAAAFKKPATIFIGERVIKNTGPSFHPKSHRYIYIKETFPQKLMRKVRNRLHL